MCGAAASASAGGTQRRAEESPDAFRLSCISDLTAGKTQETPNYRYTVVIPAHSVKQITLDYLLLANSNGHVLHTATLAHSDFVPEEPDMPDVPSTPGEPEAPKGILGDVDGSGDVDAPDYLLVKRAVLGTYVIEQP